MSLIQKLKEFHDAFAVEGKLRSFKWEQLTDVEVAKVAQLRFLLIREEATELVKAIKDSEPDINNKELQADILKEMCDLIYVVVGFSEMLGWDIDEAFTRVHASNMSKLGDDGKPILRDDGKVMKGPNYKPPYLLDLVGFEKDVAVQET